MTDLSSTAINELRRHARSAVRELGLLNDAYFEIGITLAERHLLIELAESPSPTMGEIAERLLLDKSTVSRLISKAVKKGYIVCNIDKKDKRKRFLQMTERGKQTLQAVEPIAFNQTKQALLTLAHEEIEMVYRGIELYAKGLKNSRTKEVVAKLHLGPNLPFLRRIRISRKSPMANRICRFARNRTDAKIIKFGLQSEFCNYL